MLRQSWLEPLALGDRNGHGICRVESFAIVAPYTLRVRFDDHSEQIINFDAVLGGDLYRPLRDLRLFEQVRIDPEAHTLVWPNCADFDPETLHDWRKYADSLTARAREWDMAAAR
jgi:hypothetical protein